MQYSMEETWLYACQWGRCPDAQPCFCFFHLFSSSADNKVLAYLCYTDASSRVGAHHAANEVHQFITLLFQINLREILSSQPLPPFTSTVNTIKSVFVYAARHKFVYTLVRDNNICRGFQDRHSKAEKRSNVRICPMNTVQTVRPT